MTAYERVAAQLAEEGRRDARLLKWLRRRVNADLRYWRGYPGTLPADRCAWQVQDCKARLDLLRWAEHWQEIRDPGYDMPDRVRGHDDRAPDRGHGRRPPPRAGLPGRDGWRDEWDLLRLPLCGIDWL